MKYHSRSIILCIYTHLLLVFLLIDLHEIVSFNTCLLRFVTSRSSSSTSQAFSSTTSLKSSLIIPPSSSSSSSSKDDKDSKGKNVQSSSPLILLPSTNNIDNNEENEKQSNRNTQQKSSFWYTLTPSEKAILQEIEDKKRGFNVPYSLYFDADGQGPLLDECYRSLDGEDDSKKTCLFTIGLDLSDPLYGVSHLHPNLVAESPSSHDQSSTQIIKGIHELIDGGFDSFQISSSPDSFSYYSNLPYFREKQRFGERHIYRKLCKETPKSVLRNCQLTTRIEVPQDINNNKLYHQHSDLGEGGFQNGYYIRKDISSSLLRMGAECLDNVQIVYRENSPYHLDVLYTLLELQEQGKIRSISGMDFPSHILEEISANGFPDLTSNQVSCNLLDQRNIMNTSNGNTKMVYSNPLLGGFLSEEFLQYRSDSYGPPIPEFDLNWSQRKHLRKTILPWGSRAYTKLPRTKKQAQPKQPPNPSWDVFHKYVLENTLRDIAHSKHNVSMSSVALRYLMQKSANRKEDILGSVLISSSVGIAEDWFMDRTKKLNSGKRNKNSSFDKALKSRNRVQSLREVFTFELDDVDMERLDEVSSLGRSGLSISDISEKSHY